LEQEIRKEETYLIFSFSWIRFAWASSVQDFGGSANEG